MINEQSKYDDLEGFLTQEPSQRYESIKNKNELAYHILKHLHHLLIKIMLNLSTQEQQYCQFLSTRPNLTRQCTITERQDV